MKILTGIDVAFKPFGGSLLCCNDWYSNLPSDVEIRFLTLPSPTGGKWWSIDDVIFLDIEKSRDPAQFHRYVDELTSVVSQQIEDYKPDIIHCQHLNYGLSRAFANVKTTIPRIGICHGTDVQTALTHSIFKRNLYSICDKMDALIFPNETMHRDFLAVYKKPTNHFISALGIPDSFFSAERQGTDFDGTGVLNVLYAGRLLHWKGADLVIESMAYTRSNIHLTVIGNEDEAGYMQQLLGIIASHGLENRVTLMQQLSREDLMRAFSNYDVIVFPSRELEAFCLTVIEAQANGLPVIFNPGGGITETVGDSGIRLLACTAQDIALALEEVYEDPQILEDLRIKGYLNAEYYRMSSSTQRLFDLSKNIIEQHANQILQ